MAVRSLGSLTLDLVARTGNFTGPMDRAKRHTKKTSDDISKYGKAIGVAIGAGAIAAAAGITMMVNRQRELIDQTAKTAQQLDTTYASMAVLERAGELGGVGIDKITAASRQLNLNIGKAIQGADAQVKAFDRLGLSAKDVYDLPLDERIATINQALRDNVQASERAAVAADLFGSRNAAAMRQLDPETIKEANRQAEIFGLKLSDVDSTKVEMANDAMSTFGMLGDGIGKQLTVELAPILKAIGDRFLESAEKAGGLGTVVQDAVSKAVDAIAFLIDAGDGVKRAFTIVADIVVGVLTTAQYRALELAASVTEAVNRIPGVNIDTSGMRQSANEARMIAAEAAANIQRTLDEPLAGTKFKQFYADAQAAAQAAAEAIVATRKTLNETNDEAGQSGDRANRATRKTVDLVQQQISAIERAAATWGMSADEVKVYDLRLAGATETQVQYAASILETVSALDAQAEAAKKAAADQDRINAQLGSVLDFLKTEEQLLAESYEARRQIILDNTIMAEEEKAAVILALNEKLNEELLAMERQRQAVMLAGYSELFDALGGLSAQFAGEQSDAARAMFAVSRAFAVADAIVKIQQGIASAAAIPFPANIPAMASVAAATAGIVPTIKGTQMTGMAHDGIDAIPKTGTWFLEKGERVMTAETSAKLDRAIEDIRSQRFYGGSSVNQNIYVQGQVDRRTANQMATDTARKQRLAQARLGS